MMLLNFNELKSKKGIPYTRVHIGRLENKGQFPKRVKIGSNRVGWVEQEIDAMIQAKMNARMPPPPIASPDNARPAECDH